jgi:hypothetical protein
MTFALTWGGMGSRRNSALTKPLAAVYRLAIICAAVGLASAMAFSSLCDYAGDRFEGSCHWRAFRMCHPESRARRRPR